MDILEEITEKLSKLPTPKREEIKEKLMADILNKHKEQSIQDKKNINNKKFDEHKKIEIANEAQRLNINSFVARMYQCNEKTVRTYRNKHISKSELNKSNKKEKK